MPTARSSSSRSSASYSPSGRKRTGTAGSKRRRAAAERKQVVVYKAPKRIASTSHTPELVKVYEPNPDGISYTKKWVTKAEKKRIEQQQSMFDNAAPMTELDEYYAAKAANVPFTNEGRPGCLNGQFRGRDGRCKFVPVEGMNGMPATPSATGVQWTQNGQTKMALTNGRVFTLPSLPGFMNGGSANEADLQDPRIQSWRENAAGAPWKKWAPGYSATRACGPDQLQTPEQDCINVKDMFSTGWRRGQFGNIQVARPAQMSYADQTYNPYANLNSSFNQAQPVTRFPSTFRTQI